MAFSKAPFLPDRNDVFYNDGRDSLWQNAFVRMVSTGLTQRGPDPQKMHCYVSQAEFPNCCGAMLLQGWYWNGAAWDEGVFLEFVKYLIMQPTYRTLHRMHITLIPSIERGPEYRRFIDNVNGEVEQQGDQDPNWRMFKVLLDNFPVIAKWSNPVHPGHEIAVVCLNPDDQGANANLNFQADALNRS